MAQLNCKRAGCSDVFRSFLVKNATYDGFLEIPIINYCDLKPSKIISFSKAIASKNYDYWVHFYEDDVAFERLWNNPKKYLPILMNFEGVITPDFSLYRDMPLIMQYWNIYRSRAIGRWLQDNGIPVIPNVRWGDYRSSSICCLGVPKKGTIAIGSHGNIRIKEDRKHFISGLEKVISILTPKTIIVYGTAPEYIFDKYIDNGIEILQFDSSFAVSRRKEDA